MSKKLQTQETVSDFTRRAIHASSEIIPPVVFVPLALRRSRRRVVGHAVTRAPVSEAEMAEDIARAAPHKFLIAVMEGQPLPRFTITEQAGGSLKVEVEYVVPSIEDRVTAASALHTKRGARGPERDIEFEAAIATQAGKEV